MTIAATGATGASANPGSPASPAAGDAVLDPNIFVKLLIAEIKNQDPTKPMDTAQLVQQLSTISQVQQGAQANSKLAAMLETISLGQSAALVGRSVTSEQGEDLGVVQAVRYTGQGLVARFEDGREITLGPGMTIRT